MRRLRLHCRREPVDSPPRAAGHVVILRTFEPIQLCGAHSSATHHISTCMAAGTTLGQLDLGSTRVRPDARRGALVNAAAVSNSYRPRSIYTQP